MSRLKRIRNDYKHVRETNDVSILLAKLDIALETLEKISQEAAATWIADDAQKAITAINTDQGF